MLNCYGNCDIDQNGINYISLIKLNTSSNKKITDINHMKDSLRILFCMYNNCGIDQNGIKELQLCEPYASNNKKINSVNHMKKSLKILYCEYDCGITKMRISDVKLDMLEYYCNNKIDISKYQKLQYFKCSYNGQLYGRYSGYSIEAAKKALTDIIRYKNDNLFKNIIFKFSLKESTRGSLRNEYNIEGCRIELNCPLELATINITGKTIKNIGAKTLLVK